MNVIYTDDPVGSWNSILYQNQNNSFENQSYFQNQVSNFSSTLTSIGREFMESSRDIYNKLNSFEVKAAAEAALRAAAGIFVNFIKQITGVGEMQTAPIIMQRWIMANPQVRHLYHQQRIHGYADSYVDYHPNTIGQTHYDYRRVMDGVVEDEEDGSYAYFYPDELIEGDVELTHYEKMQVISTWDAMNIVLSRMKEDPTNTYGGNM